jgi:hypothetical protein
MDIPIRDRDGRAVGEMQAVKHHGRQRRRVEKVLTTKGANQVPADRQACLHRAMTSKGAGVTLLVFLGVVVVVGGTL